MRHVDLDPVSAVIELFARRFAGLDGTIGDLNAFRHFEFGSVAFERIASGGGDGAGGDEQAWSWNVSEFDGLLDAHVAVTSAFSLDVAHWGEALLPGAPCRHRCAGGAQGERSVEAVGGVSALSWMFAM